jgi:hypothetical protein
MFLGAPTNTSFHQSTKSRLRSGTMTNPSVGGHRIRGSHTDDVQRGTTLRRRKVAPRSGAFCHAARADPTGEPPLRPTQDPSVSQGLGRGAGVSAPPDPGGRPRARGGKRAATEACRERSGPAHEKMACGRSGGRRGQL